MVLTDVHRMEAGLHWTEPAVVVIDPGVQSPSVETYNLVSRLAHEVAASAEASFSCVQICAPILSGGTLAEIASRGPIGAVISLGSHAHVTEASSWADALRADLKRWVVDAGVPFLGICYSHQLLGDLFGNPVGYLRNSHKYRFGKFYGYRSSELVSPRLRALFARVQSRDLLLGNAAGLAAIDAFRSLRSLPEADARKLLGFPAWKLTAAEARLMRFIEERCPREFTAHARHMQEVYGLRCGELSCGARSEACGMDALVHRSKPIFSLQAHPETFHTSRDGERLIRNFLWMSLLRP